MGFQSPSISAASMNCHMQTTRSTSWSATTWSTTYSIPSKPISEFARILRIDGRVIILMLHPCFYNKHAERDQATNGLIASSYFDTRSIEQAFEVDGLTSPVANTAWFRPLEFYTEELRKSGFAITSLTEPHPSADQVRTDHWWRKGFTRPLFMLLTAQKLPR